jgi:prepilin signal peptidase PulO-like enzyme (type II secretory pathway)
MLFFAKIPDACFFIASIGLGFAAACQDIRDKKFSLWIALALLCIGVCWCVKQEFFPLSTIPIVCGMAVAKCVELVKHKTMIGGGDALLMIAAGFFITVDEVPVFLIFCGGGGLITFCLQRLLRGGGSQDVSTAAAIPFVPVIVASQWLTFFLYCYRTC